MELLKKFLPIIFSFCLAYLGDLLFSIPNGFPFKKYKIHPWFSFSIPTFIGIILSGIITHSFFPILIVNLDYELVNIIRMISTITIIYRIALGLDLAVLKQHKTSIFALGILPNLLEALYVAVFSQYYSGLNTEFAYSLGFDVSGAATAILMPILLGFKQEKIGEFHSIPSILLAGAVIDNIFSIFAFNFARTFALAQTPQNVASIFHMRLEGFLMGVILGVLFGLVYRILINRVKQRSFFIVSYSIGVIMVFCLDFFGFRGAGFLLVWLSMLISTSNHEPGLLEISNNCWIILRLFLFFFIGISIDFKELTSPLLQSTVFLIIASTSIRVTTALLCLYVLENFTKKELVFSSLTWISKASLQAALGTAMLFESVSQGLEASIVKQSLIVAQISICYILLTGPLGAVLIKKYGRRLLDSEGAEKSLTDEEDERFFVENKQNTGRSIC